MNINRAELCACNRIFRDSMSVIQNMTKLTMVQWHRACTMYTVYVSVISIVFSSRSKKKKQKNWRACEQVGKKTIKWDKKKNHQQQQQQTNNIAFTKVHSSISVVSCVGVWTRNTNNNNPILTVQYVEMEIWWLFLSTVRSFNFSKNCGELNDDERVSFSKWILLFIWLITYWSSLIVEWVTVRLSYRHNLSDNLHIRHLYQLTFVREYRISRQNMFSPINEVSIFTKTTWSAIHIEQRTFIHWTHPNVLWQFLLYRSFCIRIYIHAYFKRHAFHLLWNIKSFQKPPNDSAHQFCSHCYSYSTSFFLRKKKFYFNFPICRRQILSFDLSSLNNRLNFVTKCIGVSELTQFND